MLQNYLLLLLRIDWQILIFYKILELFVLRKCTNAIIDKPINQNIVEFVNIDWFGSRYPPEH